MMKWELNVKCFLNNWCKTGRENNESYAVVIACLRTRIFFEILRSVNAIVRGSASSFYRREIGSCGVFFSDGRILTCCVVANVRQFFKVKLF